MGWVDAAGWPLPGSVNDLEVSCLHAGATAVRIKAVGSIYFHPFIGDYLDAVNAFPHSLRPDDKKKRPGTAPAYSCAPMAGAYTPGQVVTWTSQTSLQAKWLPTWKLGYKPSWWFLLFVQYLSGAART